MAKKANLSGVHINPHAIGPIIGTSSWGENAGAGLTSTGSSQTDALQLTADVNHVSTVGASTGVKLDPNASLSDSCFIYNASGTTLTIYPDTGSSINNGTATTGSVSLVTHKAAEFVKTSPTNWAYVVTG